jgi:hypothetical protein
MYLLYTYLPFFFLQFEIETLARKGLFYSRLDKKDLAYEFVKKGIRHDMKSHICKEGYNITKD